jgi:hypothetical protein
MITSDISDKRKAFQHREGIFIKKEKGNKFPA